MVTSLKDVKDRDFDVVAIRCGAADKRGRRFINQAQNHNACTGEPLALDPSPHTFLRFTAYAVFDREFLDEYGVRTHRSRVDAPAWLRTAASQQHLAERLGTRPISITSQRPPRLVDAPGGSMPLNGPAGRWSRRWSRR